MKRFQGKIAVVTGGNSGIGRASAIRFAQEGASVAVVARNETTGSDTVDELARLGAHASFHRADIADPAQVEGAMQSILARYGRIDVAFNNAGIAGSAQRFDGVTADEFKAVLMTNVMGLFHCMQPQIAHFLSRGRGVIVNCASVSGLVGVPHQSAYAASKHAVVGLTKSVALEYASKGIRINAVCPAGVLTPLLKNYLRALPEGQKHALSPPPIGRAATEEEVAGIVAWLCSDEASYVVGQAYAVDGGYTTG